MLLLDSVKQLSFPVMPAIYPYYISHRQKQLPTGAGYQMKSHWNNGIETDSSGCSLDPRYYTKGT
jgi:hypothetical protein